MDDNIGGVGLGSLIGPITLHSMGLRLSGRVIRATSNLYDVIGGNRFVRTPC